ncbi:MAG: hybrid sensor histidine kinase/response regulator [Candidatus Nitrotoga sp.]|nr:hybrid sensor histidine kinase/response regulator [Candidatus Nitrotoga sp.]
MIADKELRNLFKIESEERLQHLDDGLLRLEKTPTDQSLLEDLFREAHSLKGAARMLGLAEIQTVAHQLEDALGAARKGGAALQPEAVAEMNQTLDAIRRLVQEAITEQTVPQPEIPNPQLLDVPQSEIRNSQSAIPQSPAFHIETIHVDPKKLDALLTQAGELTVTKIRIARRLAEMDELLDYCEEWSRAVHAGQANADGKITQRLESLQGMLNHLRDRAYEDSARLGFIADQLESGIRTMRLLPMSTLFGLFPRLVHDLARDQRKEAELIVEGEETVADRHVLEGMKDPLMHILRNAIDHGIESPEQREQVGKPRAGTIRIKASQTPASIVIEVSDDGRGLDLDVIKGTALKRGMYREDELASMSPAQVQSLILVPGFSTSSFVTDVSGRGVGLDVVHNNVERLKGALQIESAPGRGLTLRAQLPVSLTTVRVLIISAHGGRYALPVEHVQFSRTVQLQEIYTMEGRQTVSLDGQAISVAWLLELLGIATSAPKPPSRGSQPASICVVLAVGEERFGLMVDELLDELEVMLKPQTKLLKRVRNVSGATILATGEVCMVLNPHDLLKTLRKLSGATAPMVAVEAILAKKVLLLAEDSITTRTQEKRILEGAGYEVVTAVDGADAYNKLGTRSFDAVVSDVMMPNMTGLVLTEKIRADKKYAEVPIILVTSLASQEDQRRGLEAGANAYISKPSFDQQVLLECLARLI